MAANWLAYLTAPFRKVGGYLGFTERGDADRHSEALRRQLQANGIDGRRAIVLDHSALIPRLEDVFQGLIHDTDPLIEELGTAAYERIWNDWEIVRAADDNAITVAAGRFSFQAIHDKDSAKLIPYLSRICLSAKGFKGMVKHLAKKTPIENVSIIGHTWTPTTFRTAQGVKHGFLPNKFTLKEKGRFAPARTDWSRMFLVDDGIQYDIASINTRTGRQFEVDRKHYIVAVWDDLEDRLGWGSGLGPLLYRLAYIRDRLLYIFARAIEMHGGGVRFAKKDANYAPNLSSMGNTASESSIDASINNALSRMNSFDSAVFPPGVEPVVVFPQPGSIEALMKAVRDYFDVAINRLINGTGMVTSDGGSQAKARVLNQNERVRKQYLADWVCEVLQSEYVVRAAEYNQWIYTAAGVPIDTPLPMLVAQVPGGHDRLEEAQLLSVLRLPVLKSEAYHRIGYSQPTEQQIADEEVLEPSTPDAGDFGTGTDNDLDREGQKVGSQQEDRNARGNSTRGVGR